MDFEDIRLNTIEDLTRTELTDVFNEEFYALTWDRKSRSISSLHSDPGELTSTGNRHAKLEFRTKSLSDDPVPIDQREDAMRRLLQAIYKSPPSSLRDLSDTLTDTSLPSDASEPKPRIFTREMLRRMDVTLLREEAESLRVEIEWTNRRLLRVLRQRSYLRAKNDAKCAFVTAVLQACSPKRSVDAKMKFGMEPLGVENGIEEWKAAMRAVARLPSGVPQYFRTKLWTTLAEQHMNVAGLDWNEIRTSALSDQLLPDDCHIHSQIIKDLHRTGWPGFQDDVKLKQILLAFARYNKDVGYCQGFNIIAALILQVVDFNVENGLKVMIFLVDQVLPRGYFDQSLRALSVDMAVLRELMQQRLPNTVQHLEKIQSSSGDYEPPLTNVFTMHWFLTLFATCVPRECVFRIWDAVMLDGSEVLLRTAVALWARLSRRITKTKSADEFYSLMERMSKQLTEMNNDEQDNLITVIYSMSPFPYPGLAETREKYTWNIQPHSTTFQLFQKSVTNILHDDGEDSGSRQAKKSDLQVLQKQYRLLRKRQQQAAVILRSAYTHGQTSASRAAQRVLPEKLLTSQPAFNHLQIGRAIADHGLEAPTCFTGGALALSPVAVQPSDSSLLASLPSSSDAFGRIDQERRREPLNEEDDQTVGHRRRPSFEPNPLDKATYERLVLMKKSRALLETIRPRNQSHSPVLPTSPRK